MSYEHCERHDEEATNGCASCSREYLVRRVAVLDQTVADHIREGWGAVRLLGYLKDEGFTVVDRDSGVDITKELLP